MSNSDHEDDILYRDNPNQNPCTFKQICKFCKKVNVNDRPILCGQLECPEYKPCPQCHNNRALDEVQHICIECIRENNKKKTPAMSDADRAIARGRRKYPGVVSPSMEAAIHKANSEATGNEKPTEFDDLGIPPSALTDREKGYFKQRWEEYEGFYRDPSAYFIIHSMIIAEIASRRTETQILEAAFELQTEKIEEKRAWLDYIALLKKQLPEREAQKDSDAETSLNHIYESYLQQKHLRHNGRVSRVFSPDAIAIAPQLLFKCDLTQILLRLGYEVMDVNRAVALLPEIGSTPEDALKAFGFFLDEKYAMPYQPEEDYGEGSEGELIEFNDEDVQSTTGEVADE